jgi:hypothetical protein
MVTARGFNSVNDSLPRNCPNSGSAQTDTNQPGSLSMKTSQKQSIAKQNETGMSPDKTL